MLLHLANYLTEFNSGFNIFNYLSFRAILGALTSLAICFLLGPSLIEKFTLNRLVNLSDLMALQRIYKKPAHQPWAGP